MRSEYLPAEPRWFGVPLSRIAGIVGVTGSLIVIIGCLITAFAFVGGDGERYSPLNHFISELGWRLNSEMANVFNWALVFAGAFLAAFYVLLAGLISGRIKYVLGFLGLISGVGGSL